MYAIGLLLGQFLQVLVQRTADLLLLGHDGGPVGPLLFAYHIVLFLVAVFQHLHEVLLLPLARIVLGVVEGANLDEPLAVIEVQLAAGLDAVYHFLDHRCHGRVLPGQLWDLRPCLLGQVYEAVRICPLYFRVELVEGSQALVSGFVHVVHEVIELYCLIEACLESGLHRGRS